MPVLQFNDQQYPLAAGPTRIGSGDGVQIVLPGDLGYVVRDTDRKSVV